VEISNVWGHQFPKGRSESTRQCNLTWELLPLPLHPFSISGHLQCFYQRPTFLLSTESFWKGFYWVLLCLEHLRDHGYTVDWCKRRDSSFTILG
jgi:hypothetical protein